MMDLVPTMVDGAIVFNLKNNCKSRSMDCEHCRVVSVYFHNWVKISQMEYIVLDFMDEKDICPTFLEELQHMQRRFNFPFLYAGVMQKPKNTLEMVSASGNFPMFITPEDAIRALRMQVPGVTELPPRLPVFFGQSLLDTIKNQQSEIAYIMA